MLRLALGLMATVLLVSCGSEVCIGPFGNCWGTSTSGGTASGTLTISVPNTLINGQLVVGTSYTLTARNGNGSYTWRIFRQDDADPTLNGTTSSVTGGTVTLVATSSGIFEVGLEDSGTTPEVFIAFGAH